MPKNFFDSPYLLLENINRFSNRKLSVTDSDAQHTIRIQLYLLETHRNVGNVFDLEKACFKALVHDLDEIGCSDVSRLFKYHDEEILKNIRRVSKEMLEECDIPEEIINEIEQSKDDSIEGRLIEFFDVLDAYNTLNRETWTKHSEQLSNDAQWSLNLLKEIFDKFPEEPSSLRRYIAGVVEECKRIKVRI